MTAHFADGRFAVAKTDLTFDALPLQIEVHPSNSSRTLPADAETAYFTVTTVGFHTLRSIQLNGEEQGVGPQLRLRLNPGETKTVRIVAKDDRGFTAEAGPFTVRRKRTDEP